MKIMCAYGNCQEWVGEGSFKLTVTESNNGRVTERQSFCCYEHGILWLQKCDERHGLRQWRNPIEQSVQTSNTIRWGEHPADAVDDTKQEVPS
jgi:hypothetical protein